MKNISIGNVSIPLRDFAVARTGILGITKSGKTFCAKGIAEQLLDNNIPIIVFDAIGVWRFLKTPAKGGKGYKVVVAGGKEPDLPLTPHGATEIIRAAIRENISVVIDLYDKRLSKKQWRDIVRECFRTILYENTGVRTVILEETPEFAPQKIMDGETYAEVEKLARMGGNQGVGLILIAQRSQEVNKALLELCDNVVLMRQRGSNAIDALEKWMDRVDDKVGAEIAKALPHMKAGDCWVWAEDSMMPVRTRTHQIQSLHPDRRDLIAGHKIKTKPVDTADFVERLAGMLPQIVEEAKARDPALLQQKIRALEQQIAKKPAVAPPTVKDTNNQARLSTISKLQKQLETAMKFLVNITAKDFGENIPAEELQNAIKAGVDTAMKRVETIWQLRTKEIEKTKREADSMLNRLKHLINSDIQVNIDVQRQQPFAVSPQSPKQSIPARHVQINGTTVIVDGEEMKLGEGHMRILRSLYWLDNEDRTPEKVAFHANYTVNGHFTNLIGNLRSAGLANGWSITDEGRKLIPSDVEPKPTGIELRAWIRPKLSKGENQMMDALYATEGQRLQVEDLAANSGFTVNGHFTNMLGHLRSIGVAEGYAKDGGIKAADVFF